MGVFWPLGRFDADPTGQSCACIYADRHRWFAKVMQFNGAFGEKMMCGKKTAADHPAKVLEVLQG